MKTCSVCGKEKSITEFYKRYAKCKSCHYEVCSKYRKTEAGKKARQREAINARLSGRKQERQKKYETTEKAKIVAKRYNAKRYSGEKGKARQAAQNAVKYALKVGRIEKLPCFVCGEKMTEAHHPSYAKDMRLVVTWLCSRHHNEIHNPALEM